MLEAMKEHRNEQEMPPRVTCVRHAQGYHNLNFANHAILDPELTPFGTQQCQELVKSFPNHGKIDLIVCSPLRRTIYTALLGFKPDIDRGVKVIAFPEAQETADVPCDTGSDLNVLRQEMKDKPVDLSLVTPDWNSKSGKWAALASAVEQRARETRRWLKARPENEIVLVTHGGFLHYFTEDWTGFKPNLGTGWSNVEYRAYEFVSNDKSDNASLVETNESRKARLGSEKPLTETERLELARVAAKTADTSILVQPPNDSN